MKPVQRHLITTVAIALALALTVTLLDRYGRAARVFARVGGIDDRSVARHLVATPRDAYGIWKEMGLKGRTILFISDAWERLDVSNVGDIPLSRAYPLKLYHIPTVMEEKGLNDSNFLYVAALNGIAREIVAILSPEGFRQMTEMARQANNKRITPTEVYLTHQGFPRWFTTGEHFRGPGEPLLVYVSASYFKNAEPELLLQQLRASGIRTDCIVLCEVAENDRVTALEREKLHRFARLLGMAADRAEQSSVTMPENGAHP